MRSVRYLGYASKIFVIMDLHCSPILRQSELSRADRAVTSAFSRPKARPSPGKMVLDKLPLSKVSA